MVEYKVNLDTVFSSLSDPTRRDILKRVCIHPLAIKDLAEHYQMSFTAVAKHINVLHEAQLVKKERKGRQQIIQADHRAVQAAATHLEMYQAMWEERFSTLDKHLNS